MLPAFEKMKSIWRGNFPLSYIALDQKPVWQIAVYGTDVIGNNMQPEYFQPWMLTGQKKMA